MRGKNENYCFLYDPSYCFFYQPYGLEKEKSNRRHKQSFYENIKIRLYHMWNASFSFTFDIISNKGLVFFSPCITLNARNAYREKTGLPISE